MHNLKQRFSCGGLVVVIVALVFLSSTSTTILAETTATVIGTKQALLYQNSSILRAHTSLTFPALPKEGWDFDHIEVGFESRAGGVTGANVTNIFRVINGYISACDNTTGFYVVSIIGHASPVEVTNLSLIDLSINITAYAFYSCETTASITDQQSARTLQFTVPQDASETDTYTIYWAGSCNLQSLTTPDKKNIIIQTKQIVHDYFEWSYVYMSFNPVSLAKQYNLEGRGLWKIKMKIFAPSASSLYVSDDFRVSLHYRNSTAVTNLKLQSGSSVSIDLNQQIQANLGENWYTSNCYVVIIMDKLLDYLSSYIDVSGALISEKALPMNIGGVDYSTNIWICYDLSNVRISNSFYTTLPLHVLFIPSALRYVTFESLGQGLKFNLSPDTSAKKPLTSCYSLDITAPKPLQSFTLYSPNASRAESLALVLNDQYYTLQTVYGRYKVSLNPGTAGTVLGSGIFGTWQLNATSST